MLLFYFCWLHSPNCTAMEEVFFVCSIFIFQMLMFIPSKNSCIFRSISIFMHDLILFSHFTCFVHKFCWEKNKLHKIHNIISRYWPLCFFFCLWFIDSLTHLYLSTEIVCVFNVHYRLNVLWVMRLCSSFLVFSLRLYLWTTSTTLLTVVCVV